MGADVGYVPRPTDAAVVRAAGSRDGNAFSRGLL